jgi:hypothetical protein
MRVRPAAKFIKTHRLRARITQRKLGSLLGYDGGQMISNIERNMCDFPGKHATKLVRILGITELEMNELLLEQTRT